VIDDAAIRLRYAALDPVLDERGRRRFAAAEALAAGRGGVVAVSRITGIARSTIGRGLAELRGEAEPEAVPGRVRRKGAGRTALVDADPTLLGDLAALVEPTTRGDPMAPLLWTAKSLRNLAAELRGLGVLGSSRSDTGFLSLPEELRRRPRGQGRQRFVDRILQWPAAQYRSQIQVLI